MEYTTLHHDLCTASVSVFNQTHYHIMLRVAPSVTQTPVALKALHAFLLQVLERYACRPVSRRYFLRDIASFYALLPAGCSAIEQPPADGSCVALWVYAQSGNDPDPVMRTMHRCSNQGDVAQQTRALLEAYCRELEAQGCTLERNCLRTWFYVRDIDHQYAAFAQARRLFFEEKGLTPQTHYIASTGIEGGNELPGSFVTMDAIALPGVQPEQITYLQARTHLNPTHEYGVTFERGVSVQMSDSRRLYISGTASIDAFGDVLFTGDIEAQTHRMWENVAALLREGQAGFEQLAHLLVYLRCPEHYPVVKRLFDAQFPHVPTLILIAPVCRPTWLIEMEAIAFL